MAKKCSYSGCTDNVWGKGFCRYHQWCRDDIQKKMKDKYIGPRTPIQRTSPQKKSEIIAQATEDNAFFLSVWNSRNHTCAYCNTKLGDIPLKYFFDHILEKSSFESLRYETENIALACFTCHQVKTSKKYTDIMRVIIYRTVLFFIENEKLVQIGNINIDRLKDWIKEPT